MRGHLLVALAPNNLTAATTVFVNTHNKCTLGVLKVQIEAVMKNHPNCPF